MGAVGIGTGIGAVLSSIPEGACACGAEGRMASIGPPALGAKGCVRFRSGGDSACGAEGCGIALWAMSIKSALRDLLFCIIEHEKHSADWLAALAPLWWLRHHLSPASGALQPVLNLASLMKKLPHGALFCHRLREKSREAGKGDAFLSPVRAVVWFYTNWRLL